MKRWLIAGLLAASSVLLAGCASRTIKSDVTAFHEWPASLPDKTYVFERTKDQDNSLEYRNYENLVRGELNRLGFVEASTAQTPTLKASLNYDIRSRDVHEIYPVVVNPYPAYMSPYWYGPAWRGSYYSPFYGPFYDPFWYGPPVVQQRESKYQVFTRQLRVVLAKVADGKKLYETTVVSEGSNGSLPTVMPYLVRSAFADFPGKSGVPHRVELKLQQ